MSISTVTNYGQTQQTLHNTTRAQLETDEGMSRMGSGQKASKYSGAHLDAKALVNEEVKEEWASHTVKKLENRDLKLKKKETAIQSIIKAATRMRATAISMNNGSKMGERSYLMIAKQELTEVVNHLNSQDVDGNYL